MQIYVLHHYSLVLSLKKLYEYSFASRIESFNATECVQCLCRPQCHQSRTSLCSPPVNKMSMCLRGLLTMFKEVRKLRISHTADRIFIGLFTLNCYIKFRLYELYIYRGKPLAERNVLAVIEMSIFR
jgi:hypothetical protein